MLVVDKVTNLVFLKMVHFVASSTEDYRYKKILGGRFMRLIDAWFEVRAGESINLPYPFWMPYSVGQQVNIPDIARHPFAPQWTPLS